MYSTNTTGAVALSVTQPPADQRVIGIRMEEREQIHAARAAAPQNRRVDEAAVPDLLTEAVQHRRQRTGAGEAGDRRELQRPGALRQASRAWARNRIATRNSTSIVSISTGV